jgi:hypothetical protein
MRKRRPSNTQAAEVSERAQGFCEYCACPLSFSLSSFCIDHVRPYSRGGDTDTENLAFACHGCNSFKHAAHDALDTASGTTVPLYNPRSMRWSSHFKWSTDFIRMIGVTAIGRATVDKLKLNRDPVQNIRSLLRFVGLHPPKQFSREQDPEAPS